MQVEGKFILVLVCAVLYYDLTNRYKSSLESKLYHLTERQKIAQSPNHVWLKRGCKKHLVFVKK